MVLIVIATLAGLVAGKKLWICLILCFIATFVDAHLIAPAPHFMSAAAWGITPTIIFQLVALMLQNRQW